MTRPSSTIFSSSILPVALVLSLVVFSPVPAPADDSASGAKKDIGLSVGSGDLREARIANAVSAFEGNQYERALSIARELYATEVNSELQEELAKLITEAVRITSGYDAAIEEAKRLQTLYRHRRMGRPAMPFLEDRIAELQTERNAYTSSDGGRAQSSPVLGDPQVARAAYDVAVYSLANDTLPNIIDSLENVIAEYSRLRVQAGPRPNAEIIAEAVKAVKDVSLAKGDPQHALANLQKIADAYPRAHPRHAAGAYAWFHIGNVHRGLWNIEKAEEAYLTVDRRYPRSSVRHAAMMAVADMYDDVAHTFEDRYIYGHSEYMYSYEGISDMRNAVDAWRKSYEYYPVEKRKFETAFVIGAWLTHLGDYAEAHRFFDEVLRTTAPELADAREISAYRKAHTYYLEQNYEKALGGFRKLLPICKDPGRQEQTEHYISVLEGFVQEKER